MGRMLNRSRSVMLPAEWIVSDLVKGLSLVWFGLVWFWLVGWLVGWWAGGLRSEALGSADCEARWTGPGGKSTHDAAVTAGRACSSAMQRPHLNVPPFMIATSALHARLNTSHRKLARLLSWRRTC